MRLSARQMAIEGTNVRFTPTFSRAATLPAANPPLNPDVGAAAAMAFVESKKAALELPPKQQPLFDADQQEVKPGAPSTYQKPLGS